jgi:hypothetical protein
LSPDFDELVGGEGLAPEERERLLRAHQLLVAAGPLPELPPHLATPAVPEAELLPFVPRRRRPATIAMLAAALTLAALVAGYVWGHGGSGFATDFTVGMRGTPAAPAAQAAILVGPKDEAGNWPMLVRVTRLPELPRGERYEVWLTRKGKPAAMCGTFLASGPETSAYLNAPFKLRKFDGWIVREGRTGPVVLRTDRI